MTGLGTEQVDEEVQEAPCDRCGTVGTHLICIKANRTGGVENWKPLCDACLRELGGWFDPPNDDLRELVEDLRSRDWSRWSHPRDGANIAADELEELIND